MRNLLVAALAVAGFGFAAGGEAKAQYTVYICNVNNNNGWIRSGTAGEVFTTRQACINAIAKRQADNVRWRTDWEAFALVKTGQRPGPGQLNLKNVPGGYKGDWRYWPRGQWNNKMQVNLIRPRAEQRPTTDDVERSYAAGWFSPHAATA